MNLPNFGLEFSNPDFVKLAESFGAIPYHITRADELKEILQKTLNSKGIHIIECPISYSKTNDALGKNLQAEIKKLNNLK